LWNDPIIKLVHECAEPLTGSRTDYDSLLDLVGDARRVLDFIGWLRGGCQDEPGRHH